MKKSFKPVVVTPMTISNKTRYIILELGTLAVLADAQGYGFATKEKATNYAYAHGWYPTKNPSDNAPEPLF